MTTTATGAAAPAVFHFNALPVTVITKDGEPWFVASEVCAALEIRNPRDAVSRLDNDEKGVGKTDTLGGEQEVSIISEPGLYRLIGRSNKPAAKAFSRWVCHDVLPSIRKTGRYDLTPYTASAGDTLSAEEADLLRTMLRDAVAALPGDKRAAFMISGWSKLKAHFGVSYRSIPRPEFEEAVSIVARHIADHATAPAIAAPDPRPPSFRNRRWLHIFDHQGRETVQPIEPERFLLKIEELPALIRDTGFMIAYQLLVEISHACVDRMASKIAGRTRRIA